MRVLVIRHPGDIQSPNNITDDLLSVYSACVERGRNELDSQGSNKKIYDVTLPYRKMPLPGALVEVHDAGLGQSWRGKLTGWRLSVSEPQSNAPVRVEIIAVIERSLT